MVLGALVSSDRYLRYGVNGGSHADSSNSGNMDDGADVRIHRRCGERMSSAEIIRRHVGPRYAIAQRDSLYCVADIDSNRRGTAMSAADAHVTAEWLTERAGGYRRCDFLFTVHRASPAAS